MSKPIIEVKNLSKVYNIGHEQKSAPGTLTFRDSLTQTLRKPLEIFTGHRIEQEKFWALKDVSFEVSQGDVVGIIGRNGSGKSTLLKVLSRIVEPTEGEITMRGRVASLLEVGTGFHPELTGRENVYFNGAILGMSQKEIKSKFDEIVAFSEVEKFLDTPVKFYSSGMYVRLAFAVAAHLDPDILIVDEVLAVGDAAFQKKCLGKMKDVAGQGRTVLFVSHSMSAITQLCSSAILMSGGKVQYVGSVADAYREYTEQSTSNEKGSYRNPVEKTSLFKSAQLSNKQGVLTSQFKYGDQLRVKLVTNKVEVRGFGLELRIKDTNQNLIGYASSWVGSGKKYSPGESIEVVLPELNLVQGSYIIDVMARVPGDYHVENWWDGIGFDIIEAKPGKSTKSLSLDDQLGAFVLEGAEFNA